MHTEHQHGGFRQILENLPSSVEAVYFEQCAVHYDHARLELRSQADGLLPVTRLTHNFHIRLIFEHAPETAPHQAVVIHQQDCGFLWTVHFHLHRRFHFYFFDSTLSRGAIRLTSVPPEAGMENKTLPPNNSARSRMATRPIPCFAGR